MKRRKADVVASERADLARSLSFFSYPFPVIAPLWLSEGEYEIAKERVGSAERVFHREKRGEEREEKGN
jgi:hypothetical protein